MVSVSPYYLTHLTHPVSQCVALSSFVSEKYTFFVHSNSHSSSVTRENVIHAPVIYTQEK